tara:strand:- start:145 stop:600 length:456 start_codon:yes stop_codon:yes gene_type:complete
MKLTKNFYLKELTGSSTAERMGIENQPNFEHLVALTILTKEILQPVRDKFGVVTVTSGYRSPELNSAIGGSSKSQHCNGEAADFECFSVSNPELAKWIQDNLDFDQLILEYYVAGDPHSGWVHCSYSRFGDNRKKVLNKQKGKGYEPGLGK